MADSMLLSSRCTQPPAPRRHHLRCVAQGPGAGRQAPRQAREARAFAAAAAPEATGAVLDLPQTTGRPGPQPAAETLSRDERSSAGAAASGPVGDALITREELRALEARLDGGASVAALRRFNNALDALGAADWEPKLRRVMGELVFNLEGFNPVFTAVLLKLQTTIGRTPYVARDAALKRLIQPLAGEYGMHNGQAQAKTHRELFSDFYADLLRAPLEEALAANPRPAAGVTLLDQMLRDVLSGGGCADPVEQAVYALGYNLAVEYLADYEKTWMLGSFRGLDARLLAPAGRPLQEWLFLEVHAEGEREHAALGHEAVMDVVPARHAPLLARAMADHDRDFSAFYNHLAALLE